MLLLPSIAFTCATQCHLHPFDVLVQLAAHSMSLSPGLSVQDVCHVQRYNSTV